jgi:hypothetical protein
MMAAISMRTCTRFRARGSSVGQSISKLESPA